MNATEQFDEPDRIHLPEFVMPIPKRGVNPALPTATVRMWTWIDRFGLAADSARRGRLNRTQPDLMSALVSPDSSADRLTWLACWTALGFLVDDEFDDGPLGRDLARCDAALELLFDVLADRPVPATPIALAMTHLWHQVVVGRSAGWVQSTTRHVKAWLATYRAETVDRLVRRLPDIAGYRLHRRNAVGTPLYLNLVEAMAGLDLPESLRSRSEWEPLRAAAADHIGICNDIYSLRKEREVGYGHNMVLVIRAQEGCGLQQALDRAGHMTTSYINDFRAAEATVLAGLASADKEARSCLLVYRALIRGNYDYHVESDRYRTEVGRDRPERTGQSGAHPFASLIEPPR